MRTDVLSDLRTRAAKCMKLAAITLCGLMWSTAATAADGRGAPVPTADAASKIKLPEGFTATLFAGEPDVVQPIAFTFDHRGRMWVVECRSYPKWAQDDKQPGTDSIVILEDTDGDGKFDKKTVFADHLRNVSAIEVGFGGVWVGAIPYLQFIPDKDGDDKPDGPPQILLDGWNLKEVKHNIFSSFTWGPDGWLYATNGIQSKSKVGKPGTPDDQRVKFDCGVWRYHPTRHVFEVVAVGTTNPWGLDFDEYGQCFITNCVIAHLWHVIPGAHYDRMYGQDYNPYAYGTIHTCADHLHWETGKKWTESRAGAGEKTSEAGGGHAHVGAMIYQGDNWPAEYRGSIYTCNLHGNRLNRDVLKQQGSGYVGTHGKDFAFWNDPWFRGVCVKQGPDGAVYVSDWSDTGECHNYDKSDPSNGRIYRISYGKTRNLQGLNLSGWGDERLAALAVSDEAWSARQARRLLQERAASGKPLDEKARRLLVQVIQEGKVAPTLRAVWALHTSVGLGAAQTDDLLNNRDPYVRGWAVRLAADERRTTPALLDKLAELAKSDPSPVVRLHLASALQRLPLESRWAIAEALVQHAEDNADQNLPMMVWFGIEPLVPADTSRALALAEKCKLNIVNQYIARRAADGVNKPNIKAVVDLLGKSTDAELQKWMLVGLQEALAGTRRTDMPEGWPDVYHKLIDSKRGEVRDGTVDLGLVFGDTAALERLREQAADKSLDAKARARAVQALVAQKDEGLAETLTRMLDDGDLRGTAIRGLAAVGSPASAGEIVSRYPKMSPADKADALQALSGRPAYAVALLDAVAAGTVAKTDLTPLIVRQLGGMQDAKVKQRLKEVWGDVRPPEKDKQARISKLKRDFTLEDLKAANLPQGRALFAKTCAQCHTLFGEGGKVGPDLTGSQRAVAEYVIENVIDPSAVVAAEYRVTIVETKDDRRIEGTVVKETDQAVTIRTPTEDVLVAKADIAKRRQSPLSMMPEGLFDAMKWEEQRDLLGYLASPQQVALPPGGK
ncbi:MAG TPA: PVC-type heme-binding CxxCH protein [Humisphaera sp.]